MKSSTFDSLNTFLDNVSRATLQAARALAHGIGQMAWPQLFLSAVLLAIVLTILPLALTLFIAFMLVKLVVGALVVQSRRNRSDDGE